MKKDSAISKIIHPFNLESSSTQTESESRTIRLGGISKTVSVFNKKKGEWESVTRVEGGVEISVSHRIRTGKTKRERNARVREKADAPAQPVKGKGKK